MNNTENFSGIRPTGGLMYQLLNHASRFGSCCFLDNRGYHSTLHEHEYLLAIGEADAVSLTQGQPLDLLDAFLEANRDKWIFGHFSYDLRETLTGTKSNKPDPIGFPLAKLFVPALCLKGNQDLLETVWCAPGFDAAAFIAGAQSAGYRPAGKPVGAGLNPGISRETYIDTIVRLQQHIHRGDCYEINFCQEFMASPVNIDAVAIYQQLASASPNPFSCYYRSGNAQLMCASPERFLARRQRKIYSQPIKGTAKRHHSSAEADEASRQALRNSPKELSENVMVVDLVRNDLSRICEKGSVKVDELFGIYSYPQVHQMVSTVSGILKEDVLFSDLLKATFPMGSMTGAPKKRVMELIEQYEPSRRGLFSGAVGYFSPGGNFDFNVVIRSLLYNSASGYLSYQVGSGITWYSNAQEEYEECLLKAEAIRQVLEGG